MIFTQDVAPRAALAPGGAVPAILAAAACAPLPLTRPQRLTAHPYLTTLPSALSRLLVTSQTGPVAVRRYRDSWQSTEAIC